jgi:predicted DCC family thiol-disulfide oxidoreductase YuxK
MKTLDNHTLLYDEDCPMCNLYTSGFIKANMLDENGRKSFVTLTDDEQTYIDFNRAKNEIALIDTKNKTVLYGIDSLLKVIGFSFPIIEKIGNWKPINYLLKKLYKFISYNRKVIIPSKENNNTKAQCIPDFDYFYRILYIVFATVFTTIVLFYYAKNIPLIANGNWARELLLALGQIGFQAIFIQKMTKENQLNYLGNLVTISLMGSLLLVPMLILQPLVSTYITLGWFGLTVSVMIAEHYRRTTLLQLPKFLTATWILYRLIALLIILNL